MSVKPVIPDKPIGPALKAMCENLADQAHREWLSTFSVVRHKCYKCPRTYADKLSAIICTHDKLEGKTMSQSRSKDSKATPKRAKTKTAAKKTKSKTKKA